MAAKLLLAESGYHFSAAVTEADRLTMIDSLLEGSSVEKIVC